MNNARKYIKDNLDRLPSDGLGTEEQKQQRNLMHALMQIADHLNGLDRKIDSLEQAVQRITNRLPY